MYQKVNVIFAENMMERHLQQILQTDLSYQDWKVKVIGVQDHIHTQTANANGLDHLAMQGLGILIKLEERKIMIQLQHHYINMHIKNMGKNLIYYQNQENIIF